MESQIFGIKIKVRESGVLRDKVRREPHAIKPIPKDEGALFGRFGKETAKKQERKPPSPGVSKAKDLGDEVHCSLSDVKQNASFELYSKAGDLIVKTIAPDAKEVIREIGPEDLLKPREKGEKLRGVLFTCKL